MTEEKEFHGVSNGDSVKITLSEDVLHGIIIPSPDKNNYTLKLGSGYNIILKKEDIIELEIIKKASGKKPHGNITLQSEAIKDKIISFVSTGGTIASYIDYKTGAVHPAVSASDLSFSVPDIAEKFKIRAKVLYSILSENIMPEHWQEIALAVADELNNSAQGVIVPHGTDTMGYSAAAVSFMLSELSGPVVFAGSQRSSDRPSSDAWKNLRSAAHFIDSTDLAEVVVCMYSNPSDQSVLIHRGTCVRKMHTSRRDSFRSINSPPICEITDDKIRYFQKYAKKTSAKVKVDTRLEPDVSLLYSYPGIEEKHFNFLAENSKGIVIAGTGLGHISDRLMKSIEKAIESGVHIVMTSQCYFGTVNLNVYSSGRNLLKAGVIPAAMLPETAYVKLMWVLGHSKTPEQVKSEMLTNMRGEIIERILFDTHGGGHYGI